MEDIKERDEMERMKRQESNYKRDVVERSNAMKQVVLDSKKGSGCLLKPVGYEAFRNPLAL
jgi:hypothetical protein